MTEPHLDNLYKAYHSLVTDYVTTKDKLEKIIAAIKSYGGTIPEIKELDNGVDLIEVLTGVSEKLYPTNGTWKEKILFTLKRMNRPATASEIYNYINKSENNDLSVRMAGSALPQICSKMGIDNEIGVDKSEFKNKYYILK